MNRYRHSKSSLFLMEIILNILFFSILVAYCLQIFFRAYELQNETEQLHRGVAITSSIAEICQSSDSYGDLLENIYPEGDFSDSSFSIYFNQDFSSCKKDDATYVATVLPGESDSLVNIQFLEINESDDSTIYSLDVSLYHPATK